MGSQNNKQSSHPVYLSGDNTVSSGVIAEVSSDSRQYDPNMSDNLSHKIINSPIYKSAYQLFSEAGSYGEQFLVLLEAIPYKYLNATLSFWDSFAGSNKSVESDRISYESAMKEIDDLIRKFYEFVNTLPVEQAEQLRAIGQNLALSSSGASSSSLSLGENSQPGQSITSSGISDLVSGIQGIASLATTITSICDSAASLGLNRRSQKLQENSFIHSLASNLRNQGYIEAADSVLQNGYKNINSVFTVSGISGDSKSQRQLVHNLYDYLLACGVEEQIVSKFLPGYVTDFGDFDIESLNSAIAGAVSDDGSLSADEVISSLIDYKLGSRVFDLSKKYFQEKYAAEYSANIDGSEDGVVHQASQEATKKLSEYSAYENEYKYSVLNSWIEQYKKTKNPIIKACLMESIMDISSDSIGRMTTQDSLKDIFSGNMSNDAAQGVFVNILQMLLQHLSK